MLWRWWGWGWGHSLGSGAAPPVEGCLIAATADVLLSGGPQALRPMVPEVVAAIVSWPSEARARFRPTIRLVMKKLCRLFGYPVVADLLPASDKPLIKYASSVRAWIAAVVQPAFVIREPHAPAHCRVSLASDHGGSYLQRMEARAKRHRRRKDDGGAASFERLVGSDDDDSDSDSGSEEEGGRGRRGATVARKGGARGTHDMEEEILVRERGTEEDDVIDLLDGSLVRHVKLQPVTFPPSSRHLQREIHLHLQGRA